MSVLWGDGSRETRLSFPSSQVLCLWEGGPCSAHVPPLGKRRRGGRSGRRARSPVTRPPGQRVLNNCAASASDITVKAKVSKVPAQLVVDTGSAITIVHRRIYDQISARPQLQRCDVTAKTATQQPLRLLGRCAVHFVIDNVSYPLSVFVSDEIGPIDCLLGMDFFAQYPFTRLLLTCLQSS